MLSRSLAVLALVLLVAPPVLAAGMQDVDKRRAQQPPPPPSAAPPVRTPPPNPPGTMIPPQTPPVLQEPKTIEPPRRLRGKDVNVQIEITISDQTGAAAPDKKVVSLLAADQTMGRVRASADASRAGVGMVGTRLNVDARPTVLEGDRILLELTLEYAPLRESPVTQQPTILNESITMILVNGKPLMISQAADPISDRKMTVEVKAVVVR
jgi:hypothetical protein